MKKCNGYSDLNPTQDQTTKQAQVDALVDFLRKLSSKKFNNFRLVLEEEGRGDLLKDVLQDVDLGKSEAFTYLFT